MAQTASGTSKTGAVPIIELHDPWHSTTLPLTTTLGFTNKVTSVLQYMPLHKIVSSKVASLEDMHRVIGSVMEHSYLLAGSNLKTKDTIEYLSLRDLHKSLDKLQGPAVTHYGEHNATMLLRMLRNYVPAALGFSGPTTSVYLTPRRTYDLVIHALAPKSIANLSQHLQNRSVGPSASALTNTPQINMLPVCQECSARHSSTDGLLMLMNPTKRLLAGHALCGSCMLHSHALLDGGAPRLPSSDMFLHKTQDSDDGHSQTMSNHHHGAQTNRVWQPVNRFGTPYLTPPTGLVSGTIANGMSYVILRNTSPQDKFVVYLQVKVGSIHEEDNQQGMAHMLEHMVFQGTDKYPDEASMKKLYNSMGMSFGGDANAFTMFRQTVYSFICPVGKTDPQAILQSDVVAGPDGESAGAPADSGSANHNHKTTGKSGSKAARVRIGGSNLNSNAALYQRCQKLALSMGNRTPGVDRISLAHLLGRVGRIQEEQDGVTDEDSHSSDSDESMHSTDTEKEVKGEPQLKPNQLLKLLGMLSLMGGMAGAAGGAKGGEDSALSGSSDLEFGSAERNQKDKKKEGKKGKKKGKGGDDGMGMGEMSLADLFGGGMGMGGPTQPPMDPETKAKIDQLTQLEMEAQTADPDKSKELMKKIEDLMMDPDVLEELQAPPDGSGTSNVELVLDILNQMVLHATLPAQGFNAERLAVLSEMSLRGGMHNQIATEQQQQLHPNSIINVRQPIGKTEIINSWTVDDLKKFYDKWYYPGNMVAYIVGNVNPEKVHKIIKKVFGEEKPRHGVPQPTIAGALNSKTYNNLLETKDDPLSVGVPTYEVMPETAKAIRQTEMKPIKTQIGWTLPKENLVRYAELGEPPQGPELRNDVLEMSGVPFKAFRHSMNTKFSMALQCRAPLTSCTSEHDMKLVLIDSIIRAAWDARMMHTISVEENPPFEGMEVANDRDLESGSGVLALAFSARPSMWKEAIEASLLELKRMYTHGVTQEELDFNITVLDKTYKDATALDEGKSSTASESLIEQLMEAGASRSVFTDVPAEAKTYNKLKHEVTLADVNKRARYLMAPLLTYSSEKGKSLAVAFFSVPKFYEYDEIIAAASPGALAKMKTAGTDLNLITVWKATDKNPPNPRKLRRLEISEDTIRSTIDEVLARDDPEQYKPLLEIGGMMNKHEFTKPHGVTIIRKSNIEWCKSVLCRLSNGLAVNYKSMPALEKAVTVALSFGYGHAWTLKATDAPGLALSVMLSSGCESKGGEHEWSHTLEQINHYELANGLSVGAKASEKTITMQGSANTTDDGLRKLLTHMYMYWMHHRYDEAMMKRARMNLLSQMEAQDRNISSATLSALYDVVFENDPRFTSRSFADIQALEPDHIRATFEEFLHPSNAELTIIGDVEPDELEEVVLSIFGHVPAKKGAPVPPTPSTDFPLKCKGCFAAMTCAKEIVLKESGDGSAMQAMMEKMNAGSGEGAGSAKAAKGQEMSKRSSTKSTGISAPPNQAISAEGEVPPLTGLNISARVELRSDKPRAMVFVLMPWVNTSGVLNIKAGEHEYRSPQIGDGYQPKSPPPIGPDGQEAWSRADIQAHPRYTPRCLYVLGQILENRLFKRIRSELGLCYTISFQSSMTDDYDMGWGMVSANSFTDDRRINIMCLEIAKSMQGLLDNITEDEFQAAMVPIMGQAQRNEGALDTWVDRLTNVQLPHSDKQMWLSAGLASYFKNLTLEDIISVGQSKYFPSNENLYYAIGRSIPSEEDEADSAPKSNHAAAGGTNTWSNSASASNTDDTSDSVPVAAAGTAAAINASAVNAAELAGAEALANSIKELPTAAIAGIAAGTEALSKFPSRNHTGGHLGRRKPATLPVLSTAPSVTDRLAERTTSALASSLPWHRFDPTRTDLPGFRGGVPIW